MISIGIEHRKDDMYIDFSFNNHRELFETVCQNLYSLI